MNRFTFPPNTTLTRSCRPAGQPVVFSIEAAAVLTGVHPAMLHYYHRAGLIAARPDDSGGELFLDLDALDQVRRIEHYRRHLGAGRRALPLICHLQHEGERLDVELRFLRVS